MQTVPTKSLPDIVTPTLFIHGQLDKRVTAKDLKATAQTMPQAQVTVIEAGHWPMRARPTVVHSATHSHSHVCHSGSFADSVPT